MNTNKWQDLNAGEISGSITIGQGPFNSLGGYNISVQGSFGGSITLERRFAGDAFWNVVAAFESAAETCGVEAEAETLYRFNGSAMTGGPARVRLGQ